MPEPTAPSTANAAPLVSTLINALTAANVAIPVVFTAVANIVALTGGGLTLTEIADAIAAQVAANDEFGRIEIERLRALVR